MTREEFVSKFKEGDKIRLDDWAKGEWIKILKIGYTNFYACCNYSNEAFYFFDHDWKLYEEEPEKLYEWAIFNNDNWILSDILLTEKEVSEDECKYNLVHKKVVRDNNTGEITLID